MTSRLEAMERRFSVQEERMSAMLAVIVRIAERLDGAALIPFDRAGCRATFGGFGGYGRSAAPTFESWCTH